MGAHLLAGALSVRAHGVKVPLGLVEGTTENKVVVTDLVTDLRDRGLDASGGLLFVIDRGTALGAAFRSIFGGQALVQRCRRHRKRTIIEHLPEAERPLGLRRLRTAPAEPDPARAKVAPLAIARGLAHQRPGAAASLREGLADPLTINRPGVTGKLRRTLESTHRVESMIEIVRDHATRVKHPESDEMALRWAAAGMLAAEAQFRRGKGFRELPALAIALRRAVGLPEGEEATIFFSVSFSLGGPHRSSTTRGGTSSGTEVPSEGSQPAGCGRCRQMQWLQHLRKRLPRTGHYQGKPEGRG
jgi:transposase-like protein